LNPEKELEEDDIYRVKSKLRTLIKIDNGQLAPCICKKKEENSANFKTFKFFVFIACIIEKNRTMKSLQYHWQYELMKGLWHMKLSF
jgi:hypothetical protein